MPVCHKKIALISYFFCLKIFQLSDVNLKISYFDPIGLPLRILNQIIKNLIEDTKP